MKSLFRSAFLPQKPLRFRILLATVGLLGVTSSAAHAGENAWFEIANASITAMELNGHVSYLADDTLEGREAGSRGGHAAAKYVLERIQDTGLRGGAADGSFVQGFRGGMQNILAVLEGSDPTLSGEYLLVSAHYDHVGYGNRRNSFGPFGYIHNGADDNASGVSALLELIDALTRTEHRPRRSILFAFWDGEEKGLLGSAYWAQHPTVQLSDVKICLNVDMVGRLRDGNIEVGGTRCGRGLRQLMSTSRLPDAHLDFTWEYKENSDHWTFYQRDIPALYVHTGTHYDYHRPSDDVEKINFSGMQLITRYLLEQVVELAEADHLPQFRREGRLDNPYNQKRLERPLPPLASRLNFRTRNLPNQTGRLLVTEVYDRTCELAAGDQIVAVAGHSPVDQKLLERIALQSESPLQLSVERDGAQAPLEIATTLSGARTQLGLSWREDPAEPGAVFVTRVVPNSPAEQAGFQLLDRIYAIDGEKFSDRHDLLARVQNKLVLPAHPIRFDVETCGIIHTLQVQVSADGFVESDDTL